MPNLQFALLVLVTLLKDKLIQMLGWGVLGICLIYGFRYAVRNDKELTTEEVVAIAPAAAQIRWDHQVLGSLWALGSIVGLLSFDWWFNHGQGISPPIIGLALTSVAIFDGFFAERTGIYPVSDRLRFRYVYDNGPRIKRLGKIQKRMSVAVWCVGFSLTYLLPLLQQ